VRDVFQALGAAIPGFFTALVTAGAEAVRAVERQFLDLGTVIGDTLKLDFAGAKAAFGQMGDDAAADAAKIKGAFTNTFDFSKAEADAKAATEHVGADFQAGGERMVASARDTMAQLKALWGLGADGEAKPAPTAQVPNLDEQTTGAKNKALQEQLRAAEAEATAEVDAFKQAARQKEDSLNELLKTHQISMSQWLKDTVAALDDEASHVKATYDAELATAGLTSAKKIEIATQEAKALADIQHQIAQAETKAAEESVKTWQEATNKINSAFDGQVDGLLKGTETWGTAFKNVLLSLTEDAVKFFLNLSLKAVENAALQIAEQNSVTAAMLAAFGIRSAGAAAGATATAAAAKPGILASISADVGEAFAGFSAFFAPTMGPAAPAAASALAGSVQATATGLASLDVGGYVLSDGLAMIHAGETVTPARVVTPYAGGGASDGDTHFHFAPQVSAIDAGGVRAFLNEHGPKFAMEMARLMNSGQRFRPSY